MEDFGSVSNIHCVQLRAVRSNIVTHLRRTQSDCGVEQYNY